jgi:hypothetical protein
MGKQTMNFSNKLAKQVITLGIVVMGVGSVSAMASERNSAYLAACQSGVNQHFGRDMDVRLVNKRRVPAGIQVKIAAKHDEDTTEFLNCWIPNDDVAESGIHQGANAVAVTVKPVPVIR